MEKRTCEYRPYPLAKRLAGKWAIEIILWVNRGYELIQCRLGLPPRTFESKEAAVAYGRGVIAHNRDYLLAIRP